MHKIFYTSVETVSGTVGYVAIGEGSPLVLVVGYTGTLFHWNSRFILELAKYFKVYLIDNRIIGLSNSSNEASTFGLALDVKDFIEAMSLDKPYVLGWSMGGTIVQELASFYSNNLSGIALMSTLANSNYINQAFVDLLSKSKKFKSDEFRSRLYYFFFSESSIENTKDYITRFALDFENYDYRFTPQAKELQDLVISTWQGMNEKRLSCIDLPVLILWAQNDLVVPDVAQEFFLQHIPHVKLNTYADGGHFLIHAHPHQIAHDIADYFNI